MSHPSPHRGWWPVWDFSHWRFFLSTCFFSPGRLASFCFINWLPYTEGKQRWKKRAECSRFVVADLISKEMYMRNLSWVATRWVDLCTHLPESWCLYVGFNRVQSHILSRWSQQHLLSRGCVLGTVCAVGTVGTACITRTGRESSLYLSRSRSRVSQWSRPPDNLPQTQYILFIPLLYYEIYRHSGDVSLYIYFPLPNCILFPCQDEPPSPQVPSSHCPPGSRLSFSLQLHAESQ